jgi:hypothetical protein
LPIRRIPIGGKRPLRAARRSVSIYAKSLHTCSITKHIIAVGHTALGISEPQPLDLLIVLHE